MGQALAQQLLVCIGMDILLKASGHWAEVDAAVMTIEDDAKMKMQCNVMEDSDVEDCSSVQDTAFTFSSSVATQTCHCDNEMEAETSAGLTAGLSRYTYRKPGCNRGVSKFYSRKVEVSSINQTGSCGSLTVYEQVREAGQSKGKTSQHHQFVKVTTTDGRKIHLQKITVMWIFLELECVLLTDCLE